jgi:uncharacterized membrane protein SpoIIM required for sporulation
MSNFQRKFQDWQEKMSQKTEKEKHNFALTVSFLITAIVTFFVISNWYFIISGNNFDSSMLSDFQEAFSKQYASFSEGMNEFREAKNNIQNIVSGQQATTSQ